MKKNTGNKGITLMALVITIVVLIIIVGIIISISSSENGLFKQAWQAKKDANIAQITDALNLYGVNAQANKQGDIDIDEYLNYTQTKGDYSVQIEDTEDNTEKSKYILVDDMYEYLIEETSKHDIIITYQGTVNEIDGIKLSSYYGEYTYPESGTFRIIKNVTEGALSVTSSNPEIATASIDGKIVTVTPGTLAGEAELTITAAATGKYEEKSTKYTAKVENGTIQVTASEYRGIYDTTGHGITVTAVPSAAMIEYSTDGENFTGENPLFTDVGDYTVYYKVSLIGYKTVSASKTVSIGKNEDTSGILAISATSGDVTYPNAGTFTVTKNISNGILNVETSDASIARASISGNTVTITPMAINSENTVTITVISRETRNYKEARVNYTATIKLGTIEVIASEFSGIYDGTGHGITVSTVPADTTIKYSEDGINYNLNEAPRYTDASTYTTYFKVSKAGYKTVSGSKTVTIGRADSTLQLSALSGEITYPATGTFEVTKNVGNGTLSVSSSNSNVATATISGTTVTITPEPILSDGTAVITVKSAQTNNYNEQTIAYTVSVKRGTIIVDAQDYSGVYDEEGHGIVVTTIPDDADIKYSEDGINYNLNGAPLYRDASTHTTYYKVSKAGYKTVSGSKTITISRANSTLQLSAVSGTITYPNTGTVEVTKNVGNGTLSVSSSNSNVATATISGTTVTITPAPILSDGNAVITVKSAQTTNYNEQTATYTLSVKQGTIQVQALEYSGIYDGTGHIISVIADPSDSTIKYSEDGVNYNLDEAPSYTDASTHTTYFKVSKPGYKTVSGSKTVTIGRATSTLQLSATSGSITYPATGTFDVTRNVSGGALSVASSNNNIATASINGNKVTITSGTLAGEATITVTSAQTNNYNEQTATYKVTVISGTIQVTASEYNGTYDGEGHGIRVTANPSDSTILYSEDGLTYDLYEAPVYTDASTHTTYYRVSKPGYKTVSGSKTVSIGRANSTLQLSAYTGTVTYPTKGTFTVTRNVSGGTLSVSSSNNNIATASVSGTTVTINPGTTAGEATLTVKSAQTTNYNEQTATYKVTVANGTIAVTASEYNGTYDGSGHGITVTTNPTGCTIKYSENGTTYNLDNPPRYTDVSTHTTYYKVSKAGYKTVSGSKTVTIGRANSTLQLSDTAGSITYPGTKTFTVTKNVSGGTLSVSSSNNNIATATISGTTVTITAGTTAGDANITVKSAQTTNYNEQTAIYKVTVANGTIQVTASEYNGTYDGSGHGITVTTNPTGCTIQYSEDGLTYNLDNPPRYTDASTHTTYYKVSKAGYKTVSGSKTVTIGRASNTLQLSATSGSLTYPATGTVTVTKNTSGGSLSISSSNNNIATGTISGNTITVKSGTVAGEATLTVTSAQTNNYNVQTATYKVTVANGTIQVTANEYNGTYDGSGHGITVTAVPSDATIVYSEDGTTYNLTSAPRYTDASEHTTYYKVSKTGYKTVSGSKTVTIGRANNTLQISEASGSTTYPSPKAFTVTRNVSGGALSVSTSNSNIATVTRDGNNITINPGTTPGEATITVKSAQTTNYNEQTVTYKVTVSVGTIEVTASDYTAGYDGKAHGITVTTNPTGCTIKYSTDGTNYNLDSSPTYTDVSEHTVYYKVTKAGYKTVSGSKKITISKVNSTLQLSSSSLTITYPATGTVTVTKNVSGGALSASLANTNAATATVSGNTITVTPKEITSDVSTTLTVTSAQTTNYNQQTATCNVTIKQGTITVTASNYEGDYDGSGHGITVSASPTGCDIKYSEDGVTYNLTSAPRYTDAGEHTTYYKVTKAGYKTVSGSKKVTISSISNTLQLSASSLTVTYPNDGTVTVTKNVSNAAISASLANTNAGTVSVSGNTITVSPKAITSDISTTLTVTSAATTNYDAKQVQIPVTVKQGTITVTANAYSGDYDGAAHGITVSASPTGCTIKYSENGTNYNLTSAPTYTDVSTHTTYYQVSKAGYKTVAGSKTVTINSIANTLQLSATSGSLTYPGSITFTVTKNVSGGSLSVESSNSNVATATISGTTVTVNSGTTAGTANIIVTSAATTNYNKTQATYKATVSSGTITPSVTGYSGTYDGAAHGISVSASPTGCDIKYSSDGTNYNLTSSPTYTNAGTYTVYYKITKAGYNTVSGSKPVVINKANNTLTISPTSGSITAPNTTTFTVTKNTSGGSLSVGTSNSNVATATISGTTVTVSPGTVDGTATITVTSAATTNYNSATAKYTASVTVHVHSYSTYVSTTATCTSSGYDTYKCSCGQTTTYTRSALGHNYQSTGTVAATCTSGGYTNYKCSRCNGTTTGNATSSLGHSWYETSRTSATCTSNGTIYYKCSRCSATTTGSNGSATGHSYSWVTTTNATCTAAGSQSYKCSRCGNVSQTSSIAALGHNYQSTGTVAATCTSGGYTNYKCSRCTSTTTGNATSALGHSWGSWTLVAPNKKHTCSRCSATETVAASKCSTCGGSGKVGGGGWTCPALSGQSVSYSSSSTMVTRPSTQHNSNCRYYGTASWGVSATNEKCKSCDTVNLKKGSQTCDECGFVFNFGKARKNYSHAATVSAITNCSTCGGTGYVV